MTSRAVGALIAAWIAVVGGGLGVVWHHANRPGVAAEAPTSWPADSGIVRAEGRPTLVMLVHPQCACSRASVDELAGLLLDVGGRADAIVLFWAPEGAEEGWARNDLWASASAIPGVRTVVDAGGREAARFGAHTSGQTVLYDAGGRLRFAGGITGSRGHRGDNAGRDAVAAIVGRGEPAPASALVFGCDLGRAQGMESR